MKRATRSLLEELNTISEKKHGEAIIESRATHVIDSAINLLRLIKENYSPDEAYELERRLIKSRLRDNKETAKSLRIVEGDLKDDE